MFALRPQILSLGHAYLSSVPLVMAAQPILDQVSESIHESCSLAILDGDEILYVARSSASTRIMSIDLGVGSRLPAHCTSMGRVLLAGMAEPELATFLRRVKLAPFTNRTIVSQGRARRNGRARRASSSTPSSIRSSRSDCARSRFPSRISAIAFRRRSTSACRRRAFRSPRWRRRSCRRSARAADELGMLLG